MFSYFSYGSLCCRLEEPAGEKLTRQELHSNCLIPVNDDTKYSALCSGIYTMLTSACNVNKLTESFGCEGLGGFVVVSVTKL